MLLAICLKKDVPKKKKAKLDQADGEKCDIIRTQKQVRSIQLISDNNLRP